MKRLINRSINLVAQIILSGFLILVLVSALLSLFFSYFLPRADNYRDELLDWLNQQKPGTSIQAEKIVGRWEAFRPSLELSNVSVRNNQWDSALTFSKLTVQFDILKSLKHEKAIFSNVSLSDLSFSLVQLEDGKWTLSTDNASTSEGVDMKPIITSLWSIENLNIDDFKLRLKPFNRKPVILPELHVQGVNYQGLRRLVVNFKDQNRDVSMLVADAWGEPYSDDFKAKGYLQVKNYKAFDLLCLLKNTNKLKQAELNMNLWFDWQNSALEAVADLDIKDIVFQLNDHDHDNDQTVSPDEKLFTLNHFTTKAKFKYAKGKSEAWIPEISVLSDNGNLFFDHIYIKKEKNISFYLSSLDLAQVNTFTNYPLLPPKINDVLTTLKPRGLVNNISLDLTEDDFTLNANLDKVSVNAWGAVPQLESVTGTLSMHKNEGVIDLKANDFSLFFPVIYSKSQDFDYAQGVIRWRLDADWLNLQGNDITLSGIYGDAAGEFHLQVPLSKAMREREPSRLSMMVGLKNGDVKNRASLIPDKKLPEHLMHWLDSQIHQGDVKEGGFIFHGPLNKVDNEYNEQMAVQLWLNVVNGRITYVPELPDLENIEGEVLLDDVNLFATVKKASSARLALNNATFTLVEQNDSYKIGLVTKIGGHAKSAHDYLNRPIIAQSVNDIFKDIHFKEGMFDGTLRLNTDLVDIEKNLDFEIKSKLRQFNVSIPEHNIVFYDLFGDIEFSTKAGLFSQNITGNFLKKPINASIRTEGNKDTTINFNTHLSIDDINAWQYQPALTFANGYADIEGQLWFSKESAKLQLSSALEGVSIDLPKPYAKTKAEKRNFTLSLPLTGESRSLVIDYGELDLRFLFKNNDLLAGQINFGLKRPEYQDNTLRVTGELPFAHLQDWLDTISRYEKAEKAQADNNSGSSGWHIALDDLKLGKLFIDDCRLDNMTLFGQSYPDFWHIDFDQAFVKGQLDIFHDDKKPIVVSLDKLDLDGLFASYKTSNQQKNNQMDFGKYPSMDVSIHKLIYQKKDLGYWQFATYVEQTTNTLVFNDILAKRDNIEIRALNDNAPASLSWNLQENMTQLQGLISGGDFSEVLMLLGFGKEITSKKFALSGNMQWPGSPADFAMKEAKGDAFFDFHGGSFTEIESSSSQAIKVIGVLNPSYLLKRLQLDFSDLTKKGFAFDHTKGGVSFNKGVLETNGPVIIKSASANIKMNGSTNLNDSTLDLDMSVTLPLASNIPWIATLAATGAAGLWPAAGVFLISHLFKSQVNKLSTFIYHVTGKIQEPTIQFKKIFDDKKAKKKKQENKQKKDNDIGVPNT